jgi:FAD:protein FMN transferase
LEKILSSDFGYGTDEKVKTAFSAFVTLSLAAVLAACSAPPSPVTHTHDFPYARCTLTIADHADEAVFTACFARIGQILGEMDMYSADSEIAAMNAAAGGKPVPVSDDIREVLRQGLALAEATGGRFDPTVGPLVRLWGIGGGAPRVPAPGEIRSALQLVGWKDVTLDETAETVALRRAGMALDFGSLEKGYAAVEAGRVLRQNGVQGAIMDLGGSILALGSQQGGRPWRIGLQKPAASRGTPLGVLLARDEVINTSGAYERFFLAKGHRYHHIMDTRTGYPVENGVEAVTVISSRLQNADGPSLSILTLGVEDGLALAKRLGVDAVIIGSDRTLHMTPGARRRFTLLDTSYRIAAP